MLQEHCCLKSFQQKCNISTHHISVGKASFNEFDNIKTK